MSVRLVGGASNLISKEIANDTATVGSDPDKVKSGGRISWLESVKSSPPPYLIILSFFL